MYLYNVLTKLYSLGYATYAPQARAGLVSTVDFFKVASAFDEETNYTVWLDLHSNLQSVSILLQETDFHEKYKEFLRTLFSKIYAKLGWEPKKDESV